MIFISFSHHYFKNRLSKRFISNLLQTNYELAQLYVDFSHVSFSSYIFQNNGAVGIGEPCGFEYLVGVRFLENLALFASIVE
ncbi:hypothetical protein Hanom_Chr08g00732061 [Helianthus anomalus]